VVRHADTHAVYSWSYSVVMIAGALRKFEHEHPPSKGQRPAVYNYHFAD
jgi:hypothetical protein